MEFFNHEQERVLLGMLMHNPEKVLEVQDGIIDKPKHKTILAAIRKLYSETGRVDLVTLSMELPGDWAADLAEMHGLIGDLDYYKRELQDHAAKRRILRVAREALENLSGGMGSREVLAALESGLVDIAAGKDEGYMQIGPAVLELIDVLEKISRREGDDKTVKTGYEGLNALIDGFRPEEYIVIGARPGAGKTSLILNLAVNALRAGRRVGMFSAEMSLQSILLRIFCSAARLNSKRVRTGALTPEDLKGFQDVASEFYTAPLFVNDRPNIKIEALLSEAKRMRRKDGVEIIFVDYMSLISLPESRVPRHEQVAQLSRSFKQLARELEIPIVVLAQLNRDAQDRRPSMANLRESGGVEQDSDIIILLWPRPPKEDEGNRPTEEVSLIVEKNRNGSTGIVNMVFNKTTTTFYEEARERR